MSDHIYYYGRCCCPVPPAPREPKVPPAPREPKVPPAPRESEALPGLSDLLLRQYMHNTEIAVTMRLSTILKTIKQPL